MEHDCGNCDNCINPTDKFKEKEHVLWILDAVLKTGQRFAANHIADVLRGEPTSYVTSYEHDKLDIFGIGKDFESDYWNSVVRQVMVYDFLEKDMDNYGVLRISEKGLSYIDAPYMVTLSKDHDFTNVTEEDEDDKEIGHANQTKAHDPILFDMLKSLRKKVAKQKGFPPFAIFQDPSLEEMSTTYPTNEEELAQINGVGMGKVIRYGKPFIELIKKYVDDNDIETASDVIVKSSVNKSKAKIQIINQVDRKIDLEEIADTINLRFEELLTEIENIVFSGTKLTLGYYIDQAVDPTKQADIYDYFMNAESDSLEEAFNDESLMDYSEDEIRLIRIKFMSEHAN